MKDDKKGNISFPQVDKPRIYSNSIYPKISKRFGNSSVISIADDTDHTRYLHLRWLASFLILFLY